MTTAELIELLQTYDPNTQVVMYTCPASTYPDGECYIPLTQNVMQTIELYPDLTEEDASVDGSGVTESYLFINAEIGGCLI